MKNNILDVLIYLFEHCVNDDALIDISRDNLELHLTDAGFRDEQIDQAFNWLETLIDMDIDEINPPDNDASMRVFSQQEISWIQPEGINFIMQLEQKGILSPVLREQILNKVMALDIESLDADQLRWVILMIFFNHPIESQTIPPQWFEDMIYDDQQITIH